MDGGVIATARELFQCRHYPSVVAVITDALESEPECVDLLVIRARAHIKLRRDLDAQSDLRDIIRIAPACGVAYRLLGELAARRDENESAAIFFREALRLDPDDPEASEWLQIVETSVRPAAVAKKLPAPAAAAGRFPITRAPIERANTATGANPRSLVSPARGAAPGAQPRFARGTSSPDPLRDEAPTVARGSARRGEVLWTTPAPELVRDRTDDLGDIDALVVDPEGKTQPAPHLLEPSTVPQRDYVRAEGSSPAARRFDDRGSVPALPPPPNVAPYPVYDPSVHNRRGATTSDVPLLEQKTTPSQVQPTPHKRMSDVPASRHSRGPVPELAGFADYLVDTGIISRERLRAAQAYQRSMKVQLSTAIVTLGLATQQRIEWAAVAHQSQLARDRRAHG
ncbi:MAG: tetratricopeptide repeat protein [Kofleriaceae bacterium]